MANNNLDKYVKSQPQHNQEANIIIIGKTCNRNPDPLAPLTDHALPFRPPRQLKVFELFNCKQAKPFFSL